MESFQVILVSLCLCALLAFLFTKPSKKKVPPGPAAVPLFGNLLWLNNSLSDVKQILRKIHARYGPIVTLRVGTTTSIFISDRRIAHKMLIQNGATFANRPPTRISTFTTNAINMLPYGALWRLLRRNLMSDTLHPSRFKLFSPARSWVLSVLKNKLLKESKNGELSVEPIESFQFAMFSLLVFMCFGERLDAESITAIGVAQRDLLLFGSKLRVFAFAPFITKFLFRNRLKKEIAMRQKQKDIYVPLINERREHKNKKERDSRESQYMHSYVDSLLDVTIPEEEGRNLTDDEIVGLCSEFLDAGTDTTSTSLQWIMAELVKHQNIQKKLFTEIERVTGKNIVGEIKEEDLHKFPYLKAVILEGLRRHSPALTVLPHAVTEDAVIEGHRIPKTATFNFDVAEMGLDEKVWPNPMDFKPERFLEGGEGEGVDITGTREIKMMPFGAGRRICPGQSVAMLHLEYFVVNLVKDFEWKSLDGEEVDLSEKLEFTVVMKNPLKAMIIPRRHLSDS